MCVYIYIYIYISTTLYHIILSLPRWALPRSTIAPVNNTCTKNRDHY